jgi:hypothetical protein
MKNIQSIQNIVRTPVEKSWVLVGESVGVNVCVGVDVCVGEGVGVGGWVCTGDK